jgi:hypothetical protein
MTVRVLRALLVLVRSISAAEGNIFPLYIFPSLSRISKDPELTVRVAFAESVGCIAETAKRFLDISHMAALGKAATEPSGADGEAGLGEAQAAKATAVEPSSLSEAGVAAPAAQRTVHFPYDHRLDQLKEQVSRWIRDLMADSVVAPPSSVASSVYSAGAAAAATEGRRASTVKRLLLMDITRLCVFFGQESTVDRLLTQLLTFLNDPDWELRQAFCAKIPSVCALLGPTVTAECILPFIENSIYDVEEKVVLSAVHALTSIVQMRLLSDLFVVDFVEKCRCLLLHPNDTLKTAAAEFIASAAGVLGKTDGAVFISPLLRDFLRYDISGVDLTASFLCNAVTPGVTRQTYRTALLKRLSALSASYKQDAQQAGEANRPQELSDADREDARKVALIQPYLDLAARDINTKALHARTSVNGQGRGGAAEVGAGAKDEEGAIRTSLYSLVDLTAVALPDYCVQSILVPHQKYGNFLYRPLSDEVRRTTIMLDVDGQKSSNKLRNLYGVTVRQGDSARAVAVGSTGQWDASAGGADGTPYPGGEAPSTASTSYSTAANVQAEAVSVLRRIKALEVPPLPLDTGHLMQPTQDNRYYRYEKS